MKKDIGVWMLWSAVLLSGCSSDGEESNTQGAAEPSSNQVITQPVQETNQDTAKPAQDTKENISWSSENNEVKLTLNKVKEDMAYESVTVEVNGAKKEFGWSFWAIEEPRVFYADVTGDGDEEAVIILNKGKGTGLSIYEIHVLNSKDLSEIKVPRFEDVVADHIVTHVTRQNDGNLAIKVKTQGKDYNFSYAVDPGVNVQDHVLFGGTVYYNFENQKITSTLGGSIGTSPIYVCDFHVTYQFDHAKNEFVVDQIEVEPNSK